MKIIDKIRGWHDAQKVSGEIAERLQKESVDAVIGGLGSDPWRKYMKNFHSNKEQLARLCGDEAAFLETKYGKTILAYVASDGECGGGTKFSMALDMPGAMKVILDDITSTTDASDDRVPLPEEHEIFVREHPFL